MSLPRLIEHRAQLARAFQQARGGAQQEIGVDRVEPRVAHRGELPGVKKASW